MSEPTEPKRTIPEQLDAARDGKKFAQVLTGFFEAVERERYYKSLFSEESDDE